MASVAETATPIDPLPLVANRVYYRHSVLIRITHWINALCIGFLIATGLNIFNAHPALYWGRYGADADNGRRWLEIGAVDRPGGGLQGMMRVGSVTLDTSGLLGTHTQPNGSVEQQGFPDWATFPGHRDLAQARQWHFFFAWLFILSGLAYLIYGFATRHLQNDVWPRLKQLSPASIVHDIVVHAKLQFPRGDSDREYHILQRLAYAGTIIVLLLMVATGLAMSPGIDAATAGLLPSLFGGRASARSLHFIAMDLTIAFIVVHVAMVLLAGVYNQMRSMITGWYDIGLARRGDDR